MADEREALTIPYVAYESTMEREDRKQKRLWIALILTIILLVASNAYWIWFESQYEDVVTTTTTQTVTQDSGDGGTNNFEGDFIGGDYYGETNGSD